MDIMEGAIAHNLENGNYRTSDVAAGQAKSFSDINHLKREVLDGLQRNNFVTPTKIQAAAIPMALTGMDLLVQSKSGTGKTLIYVIAAMQMLQKMIKQPQVLIIVPTRELAIQVESTFQAMAEKSVCAFIGGTDVTKDRQRIHQCRIVIGTLGRLLHLYESKVFNMSEIKLLVLDEADQLYMTKDLKKTVGCLVNHMPKRLQIIACSATFENNLDEHLAKLMLKPILISNSERATVLLGIRQFVYEFPEQVNGIEDMLRKVEAVQNIVAQLPYEQAIFFANSLIRADSFRNYLNASDIQCALLSGALDQRKRLEAFEGYRRFTIRTMVATDLMARGVDSSYANLVINLDIPRDHVTYLHRIGRAGRFGSKGIAITLLSSSESAKFKEMLSQIGTGMTVLHFPHDKLKKQEGSFNFWDFDTYNLPHYVSENGDSDDVNKPNKPLQELALNSESKNAASNSVNIIFQSHNENNSLEADYVKVPNPEPQTLSPISSTAEHTQKDNKTLSSTDLSLPPAAPNSINTKTYCLVVPPNNEPSSTTLQPLGVSNTVDDASSIISDSMECGGYSSDTSYISYYESKDQRLIWSHFKTKQTQMKRHKLSARKRHILYPWRQNKKLRSKKVSHKNRNVNELNLQLLELGVIMKQNNFQIERRPLLEDPSQLDLLKKFENWQDIKQSLNKYIKKRNWSIAKSSEWLNELCDAMQELYYNKLKSTKSGAMTQLKGSTPTFIKSLVKSKPYLLESKEMPQLSKLSVHVAHQLNIPAENLAENVNENAEAEDEEESSSSFEIHVIMSSDSENDDESDLESEDTSSGFDERNDSPSSGIDTSKYDSDSSNNYQFVEDSNDDDDNNYDDDDDDDDDDNDNGNDDDDENSYNPFENFFADLMAGRFPRHLTNDEEDEENSQSESSANNLDNDNDAEDDNDIEVQPVGGRMTQMIQAHCRWQQIFNQQYQFIATYVNNYMAMAHPEL